MIENEINEGIGELKSDLKFLLLFKDNIRDASHGIIKEETKSKVEKFFQKVSSSLNLLSVHKHEKKEAQLDERTQTSEKKEKMKTATNILNITEDISRSLAMTMDVGKEVNIRLADISLTVMKKLPGEESSRWAGGAVKVNTSLHHLLLIIVY